MNKYKLLISLLNLTGGVMMIMYVIKAMHLSVMLRDVPNIYLALGFGSLFVLKSFVEIQYKVTDPVKDSKLTNTLFFLGFGLLTLGILFRVMHWPYAVMFLISGPSAIILSYLIALVSVIQFSEEKHDILDDF